MQYDGWLETMLQARFPKHELVVRNLGFSGDEIDTRLRSKNFGTPDEWLSGLANPIGGYEDNRFAGTNTKADVVFAFFGYNESYAGKAGLEAFKKDLSDWIAHTLAQKYNGKSAPRVVLFSPIAHEDLGNPDLPDGKENNQRLALYTSAMAEVAKTASVTFVDLFTPSAKLYAEIKAPLTIKASTSTARATVRSRKSSTGRSSASRRSTTRRSSRGCGRQSSTRIATGSIATASPTATPPTATARS